MNANKLILNRKIRYKQILILTGCLFVICVLSTSNVKLSSAGVQFQRNLRIGMTSIIVSKDASIDEHSLAEIMEDILAQNLSRVLWEETRQEVQIQRLGRPPIENLDILIKEERSRLLDLGLTHLIWAELSTSTLGYALRTRIVDLKMVSDVGKNGAIKALTAIMSRKSDFEGIEAKIVELSIGLTRTLTSGEIDSKEKSVLFWCVSPTDPTDRSLVTVSRRIALEMPYYLAVLWKKESSPNRLTSLNPKDYYSSCLEVKGKGDTSSSGYLDFGSYDYIITAETMMGIGKKVEILFYVVERRASRFINIPLPVMSIPIEFERDIMAQLAIKFSKEFQLNLR